MAHLYAYQVAASAYKGKALLKKVRKGLLLLCLSLSYFSVRAQAPEVYRWKSVQINGGGFVTGLVYHPTERNLLYARTDVGGAFRWDATARVWIPITDHLTRADENHMGVLSVALDPSNPEKVYLATGLYSQSWAGTGAIMASSDRGATWTRTNLSVKLGGNEDGRSTGERLQVDPNLGSTLYLGTTTDGLWRSTNSGAAWSKVSSFPVATTASGSGGIGFVLFDKRSGSSGSATQILYVGVLRMGSTNLYRSTNGGSTWEAVPGQNTNYMPHHAEIAADGTLFVTYANSPGPNGATAGAVRKFNPATGAWTDLTLPAGQGGFAGLSLDAQQPNTLIVSTLNRWWPNDEIYRSTDGGASWKAALGTGTRDHTSAPYAAASSPHWLGDIEIDPFDSNVAWFITGYGVFQTTNLQEASQNRPVAWVFQNKGLEETVPLKLISPPTGAPLVSAIGDIDGFRHDNLDVSPVAGRLSPRFGTNTWIDYAANQPATMVRTSNNADGKYGAYSTDGGTSWTAFGSAPAGTSGGGSIAISADGATLVWAPAGVSTVYSSTNRGTSWTASSGISKSDLKPMADRVNARKFYLYDAGANRVMVSTNGGASFTAAATGLPSVESWQFWAATVYPTYGVEGDVWLTNPNGGLYHSSNSAASFTKLNNVQEATKVGFGKAKDGNTYPAVFIVGKVNNQLGFFRSDDAGGTWIMISDEKHQFGGINDITGDPRVFGRVYLATAGRGILYGDAPGVVSGVAEAQKLELSYGPNPFSKEIKIKAPHRFTYEIRTVTGSLVEKGVSTGQSAVGKSLPRGLYVLTATSQNRVSTIKIIKQ
ncbi:T9SS type A sorting domain-containing protein [Rufibacter hautae]|uniref:T9SS type A sorting domain-containing protein n=1 Tax=Rufibacter hautae TaxID=2595005 RepID=A0A5B6THI1_9BACT|nr:T9SS type A sorting domain-containing protein [Rufibacter hautae]KAA3439456.1 T9SS type A sorting domain-containing protein [Rufibacter hautae]